MEFKIVISLVIHVYRYPEGYNPFTARDEISRPKLFKVAYVVADILRIPKWYDGSGVQKLEIFKVLRKKMKIFFDMR